MSARKAKITRRKKRRGGLPASVEIIRDVDSDPKVADDDYDDFGTDASDQVAYLAAYMIRADQAARFAIFRGNVSEEVIALARHVAEAWTTLGDELRARVAGGVR